MASCLGGAIRIALPRWTSGSLLCEEGNTHSGTGLHVCTGTILHHLGEFHAITCIFLRLGFQSIVDEYVQVPESLHQCCMILPSVLAGCLGGGWALSASGSSQHGFVWHTAQIDVPGFNWWRRAAFIALVKSATESNMLGSSLFSEFRGLFLSR